MTRRVQAIISGRVQGVGYRYYAVHVAQELGLVGTVRNGSDGGVEAVAEGEESKLNEFLIALKHGPRAAEVTEVATAWGEPSGEFQGFEVIA